jgi:hypothetical protein
MIPRLSCSPILPPTREVAKVVWFVSLLLVVPGWHFGYHSPASYVMFWVLNTLLLLNAWILQAAFFPSDHLSDALLRIAVLATGLITMSELALGGSGFLTPLACAAFLGVLLWALVLLTPSERLIAPAAQTITLPWLHPAALLVAPILVFVFCVGSTHPPVEYDSLTYHLFFPARWLQDHGLSIIPTPFGDQAPAYEPGNAELFFLWLMLPFHGDLLARVGQLPFYGLSAITLYAISRRLGSPPEHAVYAGGLFLAARPVVEQAVGANIDLMFTATFLTSVYFGLTASETGRRSDVFLWGISIGLCLGAKFLGLVYLPLLLPFAFASRVRRHSIWALPGLAALAAPWYLRNWIVAGSPIYPATLAFAGMTVAQGAYPRSVMNNSVWEHVSDPALLPGIVQQAFGAQLLAVWLPFALLGILALVMRRRWLPLAVTVVMPPLMVALFWWVVPYNNAFSARYLFPGVALAMLLAPFAFSLNERVAPLVHIGLCVALLWLLMMSRHPLVPGRFVLMYAGLAGLVAVEWRRLDRDAGAFLLSFGALCAVSFLGSVQICPNAGCGLLGVSQWDRPTLFAGWEWTEQHATHATIAYSGNNVPYRLLGSHFDNRVSYVNVDRHVEWRYHDYDQAERRRSDYRLPERPYPPYYRRQPFGAAWMANLRRLNVDYVFLTRLSVLLIEAENLSPAINYAHDEAGFPIEATWMDADPRMFALVFETPEVKIYAVRR